MVVNELHNNFIVCTVISGRHKGYRASIPRIDIAPSETTLPFVLKRRQFPVMLAFAMTIHKSQGQSFDRVGLYLPEDVFTHGQLYVALSRIKNPTNLKILTSTNTEDPIKLKNIVYKELL